MQYVLFEYHSNVKSTSIKSRFFSQQHMDEKRQRAFQRFHQTNVSHFIFKFMGQADAMCKWMFVLCERHVCSFHIINQVLNENQSDLLFKNCYRYVNEKKMGTIWMLGCVLLKVNQLQWVFLKRTWVIFVIILK